MAETEQPTLTVYTYESFAASWGPGPKVKAEFEKQCGGCTLNYVTLDSGAAMLNRLRLEGKSNKADIVLGLDNNSITEAEKTGLFTPSHADLSKLDLPIKWDNQTFIPYDYGYFSFIYNSEKMKTPPASFAELLSKDNDYSIIYQDPRTSSVGQGLLLWIESIYGDQAPQAWQQIADKTVTVTKGWSEAYNMFLKGESDFVLSYTTSPAYHIIDEQDDKYKETTFTEGNYMQIETVAKVAGTKQSKLADQFINFVLTNDFQQYIPTGNWMYPATDAPLPKEFDQLVTPSKPLLLDSEKIANSRKQWVRQWQQAVSQ
ncbi:thiamine ABC transporter substrate binding subunit [Vibrio sp. SS-MA-C1-2]|nr:thiamine ABC transporter substrate binding subunit [Vibrio sp. SS-MA-C1-2]